VNKHANPKASRWRGRAKAVDNSFPVQRSLIPMDGWIAPYPQPAPVRWAFLLDYLDDEIRAERQVDPQKVKTMVEFMKADYMAPIDLWFASLRDECPDEDTLPDSSWVTTQEIGKEDC
jgi:hypothetical protein